MTTGGPPDVGSQGTIGREADRAAIRRPEGEYRVLRALEAAWRYLI